MRSRAAEYVNQVVEGASASSLADELIDESVRFMLDTPNAGGITHGAWKKTVTASADKLERMRKRLRTKGIAMHGKPEKWNTPQGALIRRIHRGLGYVASSALKKDVD